MGTRAYKTEDCFNTSALFNEYFDGELDDLARQTFETHLASCPECAADYERFRQAVLSIHNSARRPRESVTRSVMETIRSGAAKSSSPSRRWHFPVGTIVALAAVLVIVALNPDAFKFIFTNFGNANSDTSTVAAAGKSSTTSMADAHSDTMIYRSAMDAGEEAGEHKEADDVPKRQTMADGMLDAEVPYVPTTGADEAATESAQDGVFSAAPFAAAIEPPAAENAEVYGGQTEAPVDDFTANERMAQIGEKMKSESGFNTQVSATYLINTFDETVQKAILSGIETRDEFGMMVMARASEDILLQHINAQAGLSWFSYPGNSESNEIVVIFY